jgi:hypothetical protein
MTPPEEVLEAFAATEPPRRLAGGKAGTWRSGEIVLKPSEGEAETVWPPAWASAVAVVDALCWHGVHASVVDRWAHLPDWRQLLIRALIYRIATDSSFEPHEAYRPVVDVVVACCG